MLARDASNSARLFDWLAGIDSAGGQLKALCQLRRRFRHEASWSDPMDGILAKPPGEAWGKSERGCQKICGGAKAWMRSLLPLVGAVILVLWGVTVVLFVYFDRWRR